jgi:hypothetical protein
MVLYVECVDSWVQFFNGRVHHRVPVYAIGHLYQSPDSDSSRFRGSDYTHTFDPLGWHRGESVGWTHFLQDLFRQTFAPDGVVAGGSAVFNVVAGVLEDPDVIICVLLIVTLAVYTISKRTD